MSEQGPDKIKGVKTKIFGVVLVFLGALDAMLSWRGAYNVSQFYWFMLGGGAFLIFLGSARGAKSRAASTSVDAPEIQQTASINAASDEGSSS